MNSSCHCYVAEYVETDIGSHPRVARLEQAQGLVGGVQRDARHAPPVAVGACRVGPQAHAAPEWDWHNEAGLAALHGAVQLAEPSALVESQAVGAARLRRELHDQRAVAEYVETDIGSH